MSMLLFIFMMIFSVLVSMSSSSWMVNWMMMEVSSFFFVPVLYGLWSVSSSIIGLKYFLVQSVGSSLFFFSFMWESFSFGGLEWMSSEKGLGMLAALSMMLKLGVFPFSGWMLHISENLSWKSFFLLSSIQEVIPLIMITKFEESENFIFMLVCLGMISLVIFCFKNFSIHWMMIVSSMFNICWMLSAAIVSKESLVFFVFVYFSTLYIIFSILDSVMSLSSLSSVGSFSLFKEGKVVFIFVSFMVMGMPPIGSFLGKVEVVSDMVSIGMGWTSIYFLVISSIFMFLYLKISLFISLFIKSGWTSKGVDYLMIVLLGVIMCFFLFWTLCF